jgi:hypothetical protein
MTAGNVAVLVATTTIVIRIAGLPMAHHHPAGLTVAKQTIANFIENASRLYEQKCSAALALTALEMYVGRWPRWGSHCQPSEPPADHRLPKP